MNIWNKSRHQMKVLAGQRHHHSGPFERQRSYQHVSIIHVEVEEEQEGDEETEEGEHGAFPETLKVLPGAWKQEAG